MSFGDEAGTGARGARATFSEAAGPAGGSLEHELRTALADCARLRRLLEEATEQRDQFERAYLRSERDCLRLEHQLRGRAA